MIQPSLSIVIPIHNESQRLPVAMAELQTWRSLNFPSMEVILSENGSNDGTLEWAQWYERTRPWVHVVSTGQRGKGAAVKLGMGIAQGFYRYMADVDLSTPLKELPRLMDALDQADIVIGSREIDRRNVHTSLKRRFIGRMFHLLVGGLVPGVRDTQCGFKLFRPAAARDLFPRLKLTGLAFDVELLYLAQKRGYIVLELPVEWVENNDSRVRLGSDSLSMLRDVLSIPAIHAENSRRAIA